MTTAGETEFVSIERIAQSILVLRGQRVILDEDLAAIYQVQTRVLNQAVKRNSARFPADFMFRLSEREAGSLRSQFATLKNGHHGQHRKYLPYAFTEHGAIQAANVVNSSRAVLMGIHVVRAFVQLRAVLASNKELAQKLMELERQVDSHDSVIVGILNKIRELTNVPEARAIGFIHLEERKG
jgi:hypothetical protein